MSAYAVSILKEAFIEIDLEDARVGLTNVYGVPCDGMSSEEIVESWVSYAEGNELDLCYDRTINVLQMVS